MIQKFVDKFINAKSELYIELAKGEITDYESLVKLVISTISESESYNSESPDPERIHRINDGDYQGTLLFLIASQSYQPSDYWYVRVEYGSCSGCDTLDAIKEEEYDSPPTQSQIEQYYTLMLHIVQGLKVLE